MTLKFNFDLIRPTSPQVKMAPSSEQLDFQVLLQLTTQLKRREREYEIKWKRAAGSSFLPFYLMPWSRVFWESKFSHSL